MNLSVTLYIFYHIYFQRHNVRFLLPRGFPGGAGDKESVCYCRRRKRLRFNPWVGKIPWRRKRQPTPVFLPGKSHAQRSLVGYSPQGHKSQTLLHHHQQLPFTCPTGREAAQGNFHKCMKLAMNTFTPHFPQETGKLTVILYVSISCWEENAKGMADQ